MRRSLVNEVSAVCFLRLDNEDVKYSCALLCSYIVHNSIHRCMMRKHYCSATEDLENSIDLMTNQCARSRFVGMGHVLPHAHMFILVTATFIGQLY